MPLPEGMTKLQELPVGLDWQLVRAGQTPGPGQYYKDDLLASIPGGKMAKGKAKTAVEWEQYRASQIPAPGQYYVDDTLASIPGGSLAKSKAKTAVDWECYRAAQQPGPDYDLDRTWAYLDGRNGRAGFTMKSRSGPAALPAPFEKFAVPGSQEIRGKPHPSHQDALTPWREADWKQRKREAAQAIHSRRMRNSSSLGTQPGDEGQLKDDYASSLTPWRDQSQHKSGESSRTGEKSTASKRRHGLSSSRPESTSPVRGRPRNAVGITKQAQNSRNGNSEAALDELEQVDKTQDLDPEQKRVAAELAAMPWRDQENWAKSNAQVLRMRREMDEKERALKTKMEQRPPFGGSGSKQKLEVEKPQASMTLNPTTKSRRRPQSAPPARHPHRGQGMGNRGDDTHSRRHGQRKLGTSFHPSTSTPELLRAAASASTGGREGASFGQALSRSWRADLASRAERLSNFSFGSGSVETSLIVVQSGSSGVEQTQARARQRQRNRIS